MMNIPSGHLGNKETIRPDKFRGMPVKNDAPMMSRVPLKGLKIGDPVKVNIIKIISEGENFPIGFQAEILDIQQDTNVKQYKTPFIPRSLVSNIKFNEIAGIIKSSGKFTTMARVAQDKTGRNNFILSLLEPQAGTAPQMRPMTQLEIDLQNLKAGNFVDVKLIGIDFEAPEKGVPYSTAMVNFVFHGERSTAALPFDTRRFSRGDLMRLAKSHEIVPIRARPLNEKKSSPESPDLDAYWEFNLKKVFERVKEMRRAADAYKHSKYLLIHKKLY